MTAQAGDERLCWLSAGDCCPGIVQAQAEAAAARKEVEWLTQQLAVAQAADGPAGADGAGPDQACVLFTARRATMIAAQKVLWPDHHLTPPQHGLIALLKRSPQHSDLRLIDSIHPTLALRWRWAVQT